MVSSKIIIVFGILSIAYAQRSPYAGSRPGAGYKDRFTANTVNSNDPLANRFGAADVSGTTQRLPHDAYGDAVAVNYLNSLPVDQRPFWLLNYQAIEAIRNTSGGPAPPVATLGNRFGGSGNTVNRVPSSPNNVVVGESGYFGLMPVPQNNGQAAQNFIPQGNIVAGNRGSFASDTGAAGGNSPQNVGGLSLGVPTGVRGSFQG